MANKPSKYPKKGMKTKAVKPADDTVDKNENLSKPKEPEVKEPDITIEKKSDGEEMNHEKFRNMAQESMNKEDIPHLETNPNKLRDNPLLKPKIENDYTTTGIKNEGSTEKQDTTEAKTDNNIQDASEEKLHDDPIDDFQPDAPAADDAATQNTSSAPINDLPPVGGDKPPSPFNLPTGSANDMVTFSFAGINFAIDKFAGKLTDIKTTPAFYKIKGLVEDTTIHNKNNVEKLKFTPEEIEFIRKPLVDLMNEKGIEGFSTSEKVLAAIALIMANKIKAFMEIRESNKKFSETIVRLINQSEQGNEAKIKEMKAQLKSELEEEMRAEIREQYSSNGKNKNEKFDVAEVSNVA